MKHKGFTLVELLIVIVVISILSAMMMISSSEAVSSAKASNIITNLQAMKTAALSYYADHSDKTNFTAGDNGDLSQKNLLTYLKKTNDEKDTDAAMTLNGYKIVITGEGDWYAQCDLQEVTGAANANNTERNAILRKLGERSRSVGVTFSNAADGTARSLSVGTTKYRYIYMWVR